MANTYILIASNSLTSTTNTVTFSSIPNTYTDLVLKYSARTNDTNTNDNTVLMTLNGSSSSIYSITAIRNDISFNNSNATSFNTVTNINGTGATANTFTSVEIYIPSYTASANKPLSFDNAQETNATTAYRVAGAGLFRSTSAISSISLAIGDNTKGFVSGSSFWLYGIKNS